MTTIGVVGLGQIGGSIAQGLLSRGISVIGTDTDRSALELARTSGIGIAADLREVLGVSSIVFVCVSLNANMPVLQQVVEMLDSAGSPPTVTDVASYKNGTFIKPEGCSFLIPGHPMAGTQGYGFASSDPELFMRAQWILIADGPLDVDRIIPLIQVITTLGARVQICGVAWHDEAVSLISALPHALAVSLGKVSVAPNDCESKLTLAAGSFRSATRVLQSDPNFIRDLLLLNRHTLLPLICAVTDALHDIARALRSGDMEMMSELIYDALRSSALTEGREVAVTSQTIPISKFEFFLKSLTNSGHSIKNITWSGKSLEVVTEYEHFRSLDH
ncbi:prephenate dehydrogenase [Paraburkholderia sp. BR14263]|uniref:prephenate dehydrogenase n=1 Tax=unclassified Paraburkholderia TaxID=2615204 RepID=UPI0034CF5488